MGLLLSSQIYFYTPVPIVLLYWGLHITIFKFLRNHCSISEKTVHHKYLSYDGISNTCYDCVTSSLLWPGKKQHKTKRRERSFPKNHNKSHSRCPQLTPYLGSGWYWGYSHRPGVSLSVARPDSPAQSNISRVPSPETGPEWENERLVKWGMPGAGWAGDTRKGEEPGAFYNPGTDSFPFWLAS